MYVLVTYDVASDSPSSARRLRRVAKICTQFGQRVQLSVFECMLDPGKYECLKHELEQVIDKEKDSLRFYNLGNHWQSRVEHIGAKESYDPEGLLLI